MKIPSVTETFLKRLRDILVIKEGGGQLGPIRNRKAVEKNRKNRKKIRSKPKTACKTLKIDTSHIPVIKTLSDPIQW